MKKAPDLGVPGGDDCGVSAPNTKFAKNATPEAVRKFRLMNRSSSTSGFATRCSRSTKPASRSTPTRSVPATMEDLQPKRSMSSIPSTSSTKLAVTSVKPVQSMPPRAVSSLDSRTAISVSAMAATAIGMFTKKNHRQDTSSVSTPPIRGPTADPIVPMELQTPMPSARCSSGKALVTIDSELAKDMAAPRPWTARAVISHASVWATPPSAEAIANRTVPKSRTFRRPTRSPRRPTAISGAAKPSMNALTVHSSAAVLVRRSRPIDGSATAMPKKSRVTMNSGIAIATTVHHFWFWAVIMSRPDTGRRRTPIARERGRRCRRA